MNWAADVKRFSISLLSERNVLHCLQLSLSPPPHRRYLTSCYSVLISLVFTRTTNGLGSRWRVGLLGPDTHTQYAVILIFYVCTYNVAWLRCRPEAVLCWSLSERSWEIEMDQVRTSSGLFPILSLIPRERERDRSQRRSDQGGRGVQAPLFKNTILWVFKRKVDCG